MTDPRQRHSALVTTKGQVTIPKDVREVLGVAPGDRVVCEVAGDRVTVRKAGARDLDWLGLQEPALDEWASAADDAAYTDL